MASHIHFNDTIQYGRMLRNMLRTNEEGDELFREVMGLMIQMLDGDGSQDAHFDTITTYFGFTTPQKARECYNEMASAYSKTSGNGSVSDVRAARDQLFNKLRG